MPVYMKLTADKPIEGEVTAKGYEKWIEVLGVNLGTGRPVNRRTARTERKPDEITEIVISKRQDSATPALWELSTRGSRRPLKCQLDFVKDNSSGTPTVYMSIVLEGGAIGSHSVDARGENEVLSIQFEKSMITHTKIASLISRIGTSNIA